MSLKEKINLKISKKKDLEDLPNQKISLNLGKNISSQKVKNDRTTISNSVNKELPFKKVFLDKDLFKSFKDENYNSIDLHGLTLDQAHDRLLSYLQSNFKKKNIFHIVITGLGNKSEDGDFFSGKIRKNFPLWLETESFKKYVKSYFQCKIYHGGLGAFYVKLKNY